MSSYNVGMGGSGPYFLHIEGLPRQYTWQDLKDLIRQQATHGVWTEMAVYSHRQTAGTGSARVGRKDEADRLYHYLTHNYIGNKALRVHLWDITSSPPRFTTCNCGRDLQYHPTATQESALIAQMIMQPDWQRFMPRSPMNDPRYGRTMGPPRNYAALQVSTQMLPRTLPQLSMEQQQQEVRLIPAMTSFDFDAQDPSDQERFLCHQAPRAQALAMAPAYSGNAAGLPVNMRNGTVQTEARGVFVSGLNYRATERDIHAYFSRAGTITQVKLTKDETTKKSKGNCTIQYNTAVEAETAVHLLDRQKFMGMQLNIRLDRARVPVDAPSTATASYQNRPSGGSGGLRAPTIVNGSQTRKDSAVSMPGRDRR